MAAREELKTSEYVELEKSVREKYPDEKGWLLFVVIEAVKGDYLFGRYREVEHMIGGMKPRGYPMDSAAYRLMVRPEIHKLINSETALI